MSQPFQRGRNSRTDRSARALRRPLLEKLSRRELLAADALAAIDLGVFDVDGDRVERVEVGTEFVLRATVSDLRDAAEVLDPRLGPWGAFLDLTFDASLASPVSDVRFSDDFLGQRQGDLTINGHWEEIGATFGSLSERGYTQTDAVLFEITLRADSEGEIVFATNPVEAPNLEVLLYGFDQVVPQDQVRYGYTRLQVGDALASPWRNPGNPADVNDDGRIDVADVDALEAILPSSRQVMLDTGWPLTPYVDVNGDRWVTDADIEMVQALFANVFDTEQPPVDQPSTGTRTLEELFGEDFYFSVSAHNVRTGQVGGEVLEGDVLRLNFTLQSPGSAVPNGILVNLLARVELDSDKLMPLDGSKTRPLLQARLVGTAEIRYVLDEKYFGPITRLLNLSPEATRATMLAKLAEAKTTVEILPNSARPTTGEDVLVVDRFLDVNSAREAAELIQGRLPYHVPVTFDLSSLLTNDVSPNEEIMQVYIIKQPEHGRLEINATHQIEFRPSTWDRIEDSFSYVAISPSGVSEVQTVTLFQHPAPLLDLTTRVVDVEGNRLSSLKIGQEFYVEVATEAAYNLNDYQLQPLQFAMTFDPSIAAPEELPEVTQDFDRRFYDVARDAEGRLGLELTFVAPHLTSADGLLRLNVSGFSLQKARGEQVLLRQKFTAQLAGNFDLSNTLESLVYYVDDVRLTLPNYLFNVETDSLTVVPGSPFQNGANPLDVNNDRIISPLDVLQIVNRLNEKTVGGLPTANGEATVAVDVYFDTNGDGIDSPIDALLVINYLNSQSEANRSLAGEGEDQASSKFEAAQLSVDWSNDSVLGRKRRG